MRESLYCCGRLQPCRVYELPTRKAWKRLYFLDECYNCEKPIAAIYICNSFGEVKEKIRKKGEKAIKFRDKILKKLKYQKFSASFGSFENERILYNDAGIIYNLNGHKVGSNDDFIF